MSKRTKSKPKPQEWGYVLFDVLYEDGSRASNRRVPASVLGGLDGDEPARRVIEEQDEAIAAAKSGRPRLSITRVTRSKRYDSRPIGVRAATLDVDSPSLPNLAQQHRPGRDARAWRGKGMG
jgi:hypothetical protein